MKKILLVALVLVANAFGFMNDEELEKRCNEKNFVSCAYLEDSYSLGSFSIGVDYEKAMHYYKLSCDNKVGAGCYGIGALYLKGKGVFIDEAVTFEYFKKSCELNYMNGCKDAAISYLHGIGVNKNEQEAMKYYKKACDDINSEGCGGLGLIYFAGMGEKKISKRLLNTTNNLAMRQRILLIVRR